MQSEPSQHLTVFAKIPILDVELVSEHIVGKGCHTNPFLGQAPLS